MLARNPHGCLELNSHSHCCFDLAHHFLGVGFLPARLEFGPAVGVQTT